MIKVCITGHRKLDNPAKIKAEIVKTIRYLMLNDSEMLGYTQLATGADTIFAEVLFENNIPYIAVLPVSIEQYKKVFSQSELVNFEKYIKQAESVVVINNETSDSPSNLDYLNAGKYTVDQSEVTIGVWDGEISKHIGGTYDILSYSILKEKEIHIINANREGVELNLRRKYKSEYEECDHKAIKFKFLFDFLWKFGLTLANIALIILLINILFIKSHEYIFILSIIEFVAIILSFIFLVFGSNYFKTKFTIFRSKAEELRVLQVIYDSGNRLDKSNNDLQKKSKSNTELSNITHIQNFSNVKRLFWVLTEEQINYHQYSRLPKLKGKLIRNNKKLDILKYCFVFVISLKFLVELFIHSENGNTEFFNYILKATEFLTLFLPAIFATIEGVIHFNSWNSHINQSINIVNELSNLNNKLLKTNNLNQITPIIESLVSIFSNERNYWKDKIDSYKVEIKV